MTRKIWIYSLFILGFGLRLFVSLRGHNFDVESYRIVADIVASKGNVYASTDRYVYGPIWFQILGFVDRFFFWIPDDLDRIRYGVCILLSLVDFAWAVYLSKRFNLAVALLFFFNPISILITGYHSQFDNLAVFVGILAIDSYSRSQSSLPRNFSLALLGISLSIKHVLLFFPFWIFFRQAPSARRWLALLIPYAVFLLLFLPYIPVGLDGIISHVFNYQSWNNAPLWGVLAPHALFQFFPSRLYRLVFSIFMIVLGYLLRKRDLISAYFLYLVALVAFSSALTNQYLAIPIPALAVNWNIFYALYSCIGTIFLLVDQYGLHLKNVIDFLSWQGKYGFNLLMLLLFLGFLGTLFGEKFYPNLLRKIKTSFVEGL